MESTLSTVQQEQKECNKKLMKPGAGPGGVGGIVVHKYSVHL